MIMVASENGGRCLGLGSNLIDVICLERQKCVMVRSAGSGVGLLGFKP